MAKILFKSILQERVYRVIMRVRDSICAQNYTLTHFKNEQYPRDFEIIQSELFNTRIIQSRNPLEISREETTLIHAPSFTEH